MKKNSMKIEAGPVLDLFRAIEDKQRELQAEEARMKQELEEYVRTSVRVLETMTEEAIKAAGIDTEVHCGKVDLTYLQHDLAFIHLDCDDCRGGKPNLGDVLSRMLGGVGRPDRGRAN